MASFNEPFYNSLTGKPVDWSIVHYGSRHQAYVAWFEAWSFLEPWAPGISKKVDGRMMAIEDLLPGPGDDQAVNPGLICDPDFASLYPSIWELCSAPTDGKGRKRLGATLVLFVDQAEWKIRLSERNVRLELWAGGSDLTLALQALESRLQQRPVQWRTPTAVRK